MKILLETGRANVNAWDHLGLTALHVAVLMNFREICEVLLEYGADESIRDSKGLTPGDTAKLNAEVMDFPGSKEGI